MSNLTDSTPRKTREDVEHLKQGWRNDPCFDLEDTEGFEEYHDELLAYSNQFIAERKQKHERLIAAFDQPRSAGEIRYEFAAVTDTTTSILVEIAAQLAEANKLKRLEAEAAPDMLSALRSIIPSLEARLTAKSKDVEAWDLLNIAKAAIAKAERGHKPRSLCAEHKASQIADYDEDHDANVVPPGDCKMCEAAFERATGANL